MSEQINKNINKVLDELNNAAVKAGRDPETVKLMAVTKTKPVEYVDAAYEAGLMLFGENRVNELSEKFSEKRAGAEVHLIGHLQSNKAKDAAYYADSIDSIDKFKTAKHIDKYCREFNKKINILLEYNTSNEKTKSGFNDEKTFFETVDQIRELEYINIKGLMTIAPFTSDDKAVAVSFRKLAALFNSLSVKHPDLELDTLSMGMSSDFRIAIEEGSTIIRIGTRLFGARNY